MMMMMMMPQSGHTEKVDFTNVCILIKESEIKISPQNQHWK